MKELVVFNLDGTLLNTVADLTHSTNHALWRNGFPTHGVKEYNLFAGNGINRLFERALPEGEKTTENILKVRKEFLRHYDLRSTDRSVPYPGVPEPLTLSQERGIKLVVASNKYQAATHKLITHFFPSIRFTEVLGQRKGVKTESDPNVVNKIVEQASISKKNTLYVGDSGVGMQTTINSEVTSCGVTWGLRPRTELEKYAPDHITEKAEGILKFI